VASTNARDQRKHVKSVVEESLDVKENRQRHVLSFLKYWKILIFWQFIE